MTTPTKDTTVMTTLHPIITMLNDLTSQLPLTPEKLEQVLGIRLAPASLQNNPHFTFLEHGPCYNGLLQRVELRLPRSIRPGLAPQLILELVLGSKLSRELCLEAFGNIYELRVPSPRQPAGSPILFCFTLSWGGLRVAISDDAAEEAVSLLLDIHR